MAKPATVKMLKLIEKTISDLSEEFKTKPPGIDKLKAFSTLINTYSRLLAVKHATRKKGSYD